MVPFEVLLPPGLHPVHLLSSFGAIAVCQLHVHLKIILKFCSKQLHVQILIKLAVELDFKMLISGILDGSSIWP